jgi:hypothetical protein
VSDTTSDNYLHVAMNGNYSLKLSSLMNYLNSSSGGELQITSGTMDIGQNQALTGNTTVSSNGRLHNNAILVTGHSLAINNAPDDSNANFGTLYLTAGGIYDESNMGTAASVTTAGWIRASSWLFNLLPNSTTYGSIQSAPVSVVAEAGSSVTLRSVTATPSAITAFPFIGGVSTASNAPLLQIGSGGKVQVTTGATSLSSTEAAINYTITVAPPVTVYNTSTNVAITADTTQGTLNGLAGVIQTAFEKAGLEVATGAGVTLRLESTTAPITQNPIH